MFSSTIGGEEGSKELAAVALLMHHYIACREPQAPPVTDASA